VDLGVPPKIRPVEEEPPSPQTDVQEEGPTAIETKKDAGQDHNPPPAAKEAESSGAPAVPRNVLPKQVTPPAPKIPQKNVLPTKSSGGSASRGRHDIYPPLRRLATLDSSAETATVTVKLREIRE
jgi:hypothetical protein